jgi:hypothetical protein
LLSIIPIIHLLPYSTSIPLPTHTIIMSAEYTPETSTGVAADNDYASRTGQSEIPVQKDEAAIEDPIDPDTADSDKVLGMYHLLHSSPTFLTTPQSRMRRLP